MKSEHVDLENISLQITFQELLIGKKKYLYLKLWNSQKCEDQIVITEF